MQASTPTFDVWIKRLLPAYFFILFVLTALVGWRLVYQPSIIYSFAMGDWLINYQGGFVRRGLIGEGIFHVSRAFALKPAPMVFAIQLLAYGLFFLFSCRILIQKKSLTPFLLLIFSPFVFNFQVISYWGGFRKEVLYFAVLAFAVWVVLNQEKATATRYLLSVFFFYPLLVLSHEMLVVFLPYLVAIFTLGAEQTRRTRSLLALALVLSCISFFACLVYKGDADTASLIQASWGKDAPGLEGAIAWVGKSVWAGLEYVAVAVSEDNYIPRYSITVGLALLAFVPVIYFGGKVRVFTLNGILILTSLIYSWPLFMVAVDWGRFIYIHLVSLFFYLLLLQQDKGQLDRIHALTGWFARPGDPLPRAWRLGWLLVVALCFVTYCVSWRLPTSHARAIIPFADYSRIYNSTLAHRLPF